MRTTPVFAIVFSIAFGFALIHGSGVGTAIFGVSEQQDGGLGDQMDVIENATNPQAADDEDDDEGGFGGDVRGDDEPSVVGFVFSGASTVMTMIGAVVVFPLTLVNLGFPMWFAFPVGSLMQIIVAVGFFQFMTGRELI